jgi:hypothetical protein
MSYALIDNATLTAVQRVLGQIVVKNLDTVNGDLVAMENFLQAILFYDDLICIDNYKPKHREERKKLFNFVQFLTPQDVNLNVIEQQAQSEASMIRPEIRGGEFVDDDFRELLEQLKMNVVCTWDLRSSVYYLTMKMLGQPYTPEFQKYSELSSAIFNELADVGETKGRWSQEVKLIASDGTEHTPEMMEKEATLRNRGKGGTTRALDMFIASLNWLAYKAIYYSLAAKYLKADTFLHPIRHAYQIHWMRKVGIYGHDFTSKLIHSLGDNISSAMSEIIDSGRTASFSFEVPIFSAWLASKSGDIREIIPAALELKNAQEFQDIRGNLNNVREAFDEYGLTKANRYVKKWQNDVQKSSQSLKRIYGVDAGQGVQVGWIIKVYNAVAALKGLPIFPALDFKIPLPGFIQNNGSKGFSNLYKDIAKELTSIDRLGSLRDVMSQGFVLDEHYYEYRSSPKTEELKFRHHTSDWKLPM